MKLAMEPVLKTQMELEAHEKECAIRYAAVQEKLDSLDKRMWRLEAMIMGEYGLGRGYGRLRIYGN